MSSSRAQHDAASLLATSRSRNVRMPRAASESQLTKSISSAAGNKHRDQLLAGGRRLEVHGGRRFQARLGE